MAGESYSIIGSGGSSCTWGAGTAGAAYGIVQNVQIGRNGTWKDLKSADGAIIARSLYDKAHQLRVSVVTTAALPVIGATVTYDSNKYIVENVDETASNEDFQQAAITMTYYEHVAIS